jgi:hypothetical protein
MRNALRSAAALAVAATLVGATSWYVTNTGAATSTCGTLESPCKTIQFRIDNRTAAGDTVKISAGSVPSNVILRKSLVLQGASSGVTSLDGGGSGPVAVVLPGQRVVFETVTLLHGGGCTSPEGQPLSVDQRGAPGILTMYCQYENI